MKLKILGSNSQGNSYILENDTEALIIEAGVKFSKVKEALGFNISKAVGCLISHEHGDHAGYINEALDACVPVYSSTGTIHALSIKSKRLPFMCESKKVFRLGNFKIIPFDVKHDCTEPLGFLINHSETGNVLFATDTYYLPYTFDNLNNIILEANYDLNILNENILSGKVPQIVRDRVIKSHMSLDTCKDVLKTNDLTKVNNIVLIHLSNGNSNAKFFKSEIEELTGKVVYIADKEMVIDFNKTSF